MKYNFDEIIDRSNNYAVKYLSLIHILASDSSLISTKRFGIQDINVHTIMIPIANPQLFFN